MSDPRLAGKHQPRRIGLAGALLGATMFAGVGLVSVGVVHAAANTDAPAAAPIVPQTSVQHLPDFADLVASAKPAVVSITSEISIDASDEQPSSMPFGFPGLPRPERQQHGEAKGSGFIIDADGIVVTNNHVVENAKSVSVTLDDGTELPAKVLGRDARTDLAVLKVEAGKKLPFLQLGDATKVRPGEWVVAVGNPFGLGGTVTAGIVSALGRDIGSGPYDHFLQIDAPINRGNSGGPLFNQAGQVVGVNTAILSPTGGSVGIGFAIPADTVKTVVADLEKSGHVTRGYLGVETQSVTAAMAAALHLPKPSTTDQTAGHANDNGALVASVEADSPAAKAGLQPGDVIRAVEGKPIATPRELALTVASVKPGEATKVDILRDGQAKTLTVAVGTIPDEKVASAEPAADKKARVGIALAPLSPDVRSQMDLPEKTKGAIVAEVQPGSPAEQAGIQQGDVIVGVGPKAVASPGEAVNAIRDAVGSGHAVALRVLRDGRTSYVAIDMSKAGHDTRDSEG